MRKGIGFSIMLVLILALYLLIEPKTHVSTGETVQNSDNMQVYTTKDYITQSLARKYSRPESEINVAIKTEQGNFAKGTVNFTNEPGGGMWFAVKQSGGWEVVYDGNGIIPCEVANKHNFSQDFVPSCIDTQNNNQLVQR